MTARPPKAARIAMAWAFSITLFAVVMGTGHVDMPLAWISVALFAIGMHGLFARG